MSEEKNKKKWRKSCGFYLSNQKEIDEIESLFKASKAKTFTAFLKKKVFSKKGATIDEVEVARIKKLLYEMQNQINKVGNNINQITKTIHTIRQVSDYAEQIEKIKFYQNKLIEIGEDIKKQLKSTLNIEIKQ